MDAIVARLLHDDLARHHQNFLARHRQILSRFNCGQCRTQSARPNDGDQHYVRIR